MSIPGAANPLLLRTAAAGGYQISRSLRFNSSDSAFLSRTPASTGNRKTWTLSFWWKNTVKSTGLPRPIFAAQAASPQKDYFLLLSTNDSNSIYFASRDGGPDIFGLTTTQVFRDPSAWYHIVLQVDTTQATASNRLRLYVNGTQITAFSTANYPSQNLDIAYINQSGASHFFGRYYDEPYYYLDSYLGDIHFIDGQALDPSSFVETSATTGQLIPKAYTGTFTGNSFWLKFADNSAATATTLGKDSSGLGNNWTPNNLSVTAGAGNDSLTDTPTSYGVDTGVGGEVRGNYCTWNPLQTATTHTLSNGNLDVTSTSGGFGQTRGTVAVATGKWYWEITINTGGAGDTVGIISTAQSAIAFEPGYYPDGYSYFRSGNKINNDSGSSYGASYTTGDVIGVALNLDAGTLVFYKNGSSQGTAFSSLAGTFAPAVGDGSSSSGINMTANFGQRPFAYTAPSGFKALCDTNLPAPVVAKSSDYFQTVLYTGNGTARSITGLNFNPDFVWIKQRNSAVTDFWHCLFDSVRGVGKILYSNTTTAEETKTTSLTSFDNTGFSLGTDGQGAGVNINTGTYVAWAWDAGSSTVTNTQGSITSQVRANPSAGFSVVTYTGNTGTNTIGHGLGVAPALILNKRRDSSENWYVYHSALGSGNYLILNATNASSALSWGGAPTSTVFYNSTSSFMTNGGTYVSYCFSPVAGYNSISSFVGNNSTDGTFVYTGHRVRWLLLKNATSAGTSWVVFDSARSSYNVVGQALLAHSSSSELSGTFIDFLSNGFKLRVSSDPSLNNNGDTYIYMTIAESPFQYARAR